MNTTVVERGNASKILPWGIEIELLNGRCVYMPASKINTKEDGIDITVNSDVVISIPKSSIRKILILGANARAETTD